MNTQEQARATDAARQMWCNYRRAATVLVLTAALIAPLGAQAQAPARAPGRPATAPLAQPATLQPAADQPAPAGVPPAPPAARRTLPTRNVKVTVNISDQQGDGPVSVKTVELVIADGYRGNVRSSAQVPTPIGPYRTLPLNVDAEAIITPEARVLLELRFNYGIVEAAAAVPAPADDERRPAQPRFAEISENLIVLLTQGVPLVASRSADAASDRRVTVEVQAEILK